MLLLAGCQRSSERAEPESASTRVSSAQSVTDWQATIAAEDTTGCELSRATAHSNADSLLREFVRRDSAGQFTSSSDWFKGAVDCPGREPGPDVATMVRGYHVQEIARADSLLGAEVRWDLPGKDGFASTSTLAETLVVRRTPYGWRIHSPALNPKVPAVRQGK
jgi:hypothetical protein